MKLRLIFILLSTTILGNSCEEPLGANVVHSIALKNDTNKAYDVIVSYTYPDTIIVSNYNDIIGIPANSKVYLDSSKKWEKVFENDLPDDTLSIFIFDEIITKENWEQVKKDYNIFKRYDVSLLDLEKINFTISIPQSPGMDEIKSFSN